MGKENRARLAKQAREYLRTIKQQDIPRDALPAIQECRDTLDLALFAVITSALMEEAANYDPYHGAAAQANDALCVLRGELDKAIRAAKRKSAEAVQ